MGRGTSQWTAEALAAADERNFAEALASFGRAPGGEADTSAAIVRGASGLPAMNLVVNARLQPGEADRRIDETLAWFAARRVAVTWVVGPTTTPADLGPRLEAHGLTPSGPSMGMGLTLDVLPEAMPAAGASGRR